MFFNTLEIAEPGFLFVYLSYENESDNWVYFDDLKVAHTKNNVVQYNDYYPYGLKANTSWTREGSGNNRLYNQGNELNPSTGWYETFFRDYDPALGRFTAIDPLASKFASLSDYHYAYNNPVMFNDPLGAQGEPGNPWFSGGYRWMENMGPPPAAYNSMGASTFGSTMDNYWGQAMSGNNWAEQTVYRNELASQARGGNMGAVREYAARYGGGLTPVEVWHSTAQAGGETYYHYEIVAGEGNAQNGGVRQAGSFSDVSLGLWSIGSYVSSMYEEVRALSIAAHNLDYAKELQSIRKFNKGYKVARQAALVKNIVNNAKMLEGIKVGARRMAGVGLVFGIADMANNDFSTESVGWFAADAIMTGVGLTGWGAPVAGIYFAGRFAYGLYELSTKGEK